VLTEEQARALETLTGPGGVVVLVGAAGTGKGVVLDAAREAWERDDRHVIGTAVAGATAQRLGPDAGIRETMTADSLIGRVEHGTLRLDRDSVVVMDEAGMADTRRLAGLIEITREGEAKLVLAGDGAQLSPLGAGGLFAQLKDNVPTAQLSQVHRANHEWERDAWTALRSGDAERALGEYQARDRLHIEDTRTQAGEQMVSDWAAARAAHPGQRVVMLTDASNRELDRLNHQAQEHRANVGELGMRAVALPDRPYGLWAGDEIIFTSQHRVPGEQRVENGTRGQVIVANEREHRVLVRTEEPKPRAVDISTREFDELRLAYAQHVYKAQGLTTDRALVLAGGWQTDRETAYVALTRARERTDIYASREDLGHAGIDADAIRRLAERASKSNAQEASISRERVEPEDAPSRAVRELREALGRDQPHDRERERRDDADPDRERGSVSEELRKALGRDEPRGRGRDRQDEAELDRDSTPAERRAVEELREAMGRDQPRERRHDRQDGAELDRDTTPAERRAVEELRKALAGDQPRDRGHDRQDEADPDRDSTPAERRAVEELREALGRDQPRERGHDRQDDAGFDRDSPPAERSAVEELRRILEEQRQRDRDLDRSDGFEL
jgi:AAA domain